MALSVFDDRTRKPDEAGLTAALAGAQPLWDGLVQHVAQEHAGSSQEWKFYGQSSGWTLVLRRGKRTVVYLVPRQGYLIAVLVFGEKAVAAAHERALPAHILDLIDAARPYVEGRSFQVEVHTAEDLGLVQELIAIKMG